MSRPSLFPSYYRSDAIIECKPILCFLCKQPMVRFDQNRFKVMLTCTSCNITIQMKTNETIIYQGEINAAEQQSEGP
jgi:hypothetical protein